MYFQFSESRARHAFVDRSLLAFHEQLHQPLVAQQLGEFTVDTFQRIASDIQVADIKHGQLAAPTVIAETEKPIIVALKQGEKVGVRERLAAPTPVQLLRIKAEMEAEIPSSDLSELIRRLTNGPSEGPGLELDIGSKARARTIISNTKYSSADGGLFRFAGRPFVALRWYDRHTRTTPSDVAHEFRHVIQRLRRPVDYSRSREDLEDIKLRDELEAHKDEREFLEGMILGNYKPANREETDFPLEDRTTYLSTAVSIETCRLRVNGYREDDFSASTELKRLLDKAGHSHIYDVSNIQLPSAWYNTANDSAGPGDQNL